MFLNDIFGTGSGDGGDGWFSDISSPDDSATDWEKYINGGGGTAIEQTGNGSDWWNNVGNFMTKLGDAGLDVAKNVIPIWAANQFANQSRDTTRQPVYLGQPGSAGYTGGVAVTGISTTTILIAGGVLIALVLLTRR